MDGLRRIDYIAENNDSPFQYVVVFAVFLPLMTVLSTKHILQTKLKTTFSVLFGKLIINGQSIDRPSERLWVDIWTFVLESPVCSFPCLNFTPFGKSLLNNRVGI